MIRLVNGLETPDTGNVIVQGENLGNLKKTQLRKLRRKIGMVFQQFNLLESKTVYHNIALPLILEKAPKEEIDKKVKEVLRFVELEDKKDVYVSQLSGGQKQRLAIARAIARMPEILIFDDSFSALDYKTDRALRERIQNDLKGTTCMIVAQRIGTIRHADKIVVLDNGEAAGIGTHEELMKNCPVYKEIALSQLSQSELE